jgi:hypothetical protein
MSHGTDGATRHLARREDGAPTWIGRASRWLGRVFVPWLPRWCVERILADYYIDQEPASDFKRSVRDELTRKYYRRSDVERRADNRNLFWGGTAGVRWHEERRRKYVDRQRFQDEYLKSRRLILEQVEWMLEQFPFMNSLCEIGTGNGLMVEYLADRLTHIGRFHGIDLSAEQIRRNKAYYGNSKVEYLHVEAADYVVRHGRPGTMFLAFGTFECFTQAELEEFLALTRRTIRRVAFATCDAVDVSYNADVERDSWPRGNMLYSHNYRYLMEKHGFEICFCKLESPRPFYNRLSLLATSFPSCEVKTRNRTMR